MRTIYTALAVPLLFGCATDAELTPGPTANTVAPNTAVERVAGVSMRVDGDPMLALPRGTEDDVTPVRVVIENQSDEPIRIRYNEFKLFEKSGEENFALPPLQVDAAVPVAAVRPTFTYSRFALAPGYAPYYAGYGTFDAWGGPFATDRNYYPTYATRWVDALPTSEMIARALPEGVLAPGGSVDGLLYFEGITPRDEEALFVADVVNARTGATMGTIRIPFLVTTDESPLAMQR